ncbi:MAG TPA: hypothetical protein VF956_00665, partial [Candidatus Dormibacteraeota bacterium]
AAIAFIVIEQVHARATRRATRAVPAAAWALPAVALLVFVQLGYAPATHSIARGSAEVLSATARGSIPGGAPARLLELTTTFGLAALPLFALGLVGLVWAVRRPASAGGPAALRFLHVPAMVYLLAVVGLVAAGAYSGSHRYLYPALPSLALLAAAALDRQNALARLGSVAAGALLAVAFLPTFASFAAGNTGLIAAGQAANGDHGLLITDSPVVAFYSGRAPGEVSGSQVLPADRQQAIAWMGTHGVTAIVLEDISYYRATSIFPDLASGHASTPFGPLGEQARYQVPGGKPVYAYRFGTALLTQSIYPGVNACIEGAFGQGKTAPLAKGLVLEVAGHDAAAEGMGFGVPIVHYPDGWVYSRTATTDDLSTPTATIWRRTYDLNEIGGDAAHGYAFVPIASRGLLQVTYTIDTSGVAITVHVVQLTPGYTEVGILNEQSSAFNDFAAEKGPTLTGAGFGSWVPVDGAWGRLQSKSLGVQFSLPSIAGAQLHGGRELIAPDFDWAGLDYIFGPSFTDTSYVIKVQEAR